MTELLIWLGIGFFLDCVLGGKWNIWAYFIAFTVSFLLYGRLNVDTVLVARWVAIMELGLITISILIAIIAAWIDGR